MTQLPPKKEVALALLETSNVDVYLDARATGVVVPPQFRKEARLILKIGLNMPIPIPDLRLDDESMSCTLSFNRAKFFCVVPWSSVFAMVGEDGRGLVWPDDVPPELTLKPDGAKPSPATAAPEAPAGRGRSKARPQAVAESSAKAAPGTAEKASRSRRPKKKGDAPAARPSLAPVPSSEAPAARVERLEDRRPSGASEGRTDEARPSITPRTPSAGRPSGAPRPKRELPPYLRVVK